MGGGNEYPSPRQETYHSFLCSQAPGGLPSLALSEWDPRALPVFPTLLQPHFIYGTAHLRTKATRLNSMQLSLSVRIFPPLLEKIPNSWQLLKHKQLHDNEQTTLQYKGLELRTDRFYCK